ncbi:membrane protein implicated in regulation of membrane protease activity [Salinibacterium sp. CAN_S4]|uniref:NfeD family protein n=1 Tax=Salinibacterium sp. CAN_S4 TaxID=2787727 RepID=UPI0018EF9D61
MFVDLTQYLWIMWLSIVVLFVIVELLTLEFTFLMLAAGSLIGGLGANLLGLEWWAQIGAAAALSALLLFTIRPLLLKTLHKGADLTPSNLDALYGMTARVTRDFIDGDGMVKLANGETWTSRAAPGLMLREGDRVTVRAVHGSIVEVDSPPLTPPTAPAAP